MGLLTDPSAGQGKLTKGLVKYYSKLCIVLYLGGIVWFCLLAYTPFNVGTYFSENALLPGLVKTEFREDSVAARFYDELKDELKQYRYEVPYSFLLAKFNQLGLDTYTHNFTLKYPLGDEPAYKGKNMYAIMRAPRAASTESLVLSVPYRTRSSLEPITTPSIAIMLAFAKFAAKGKYWSKDIIFLVTEHEQLGMQAWLEAYHSVTCGQEGVLDHGDLLGRAGAIQAAINLEIPDVNLESIDIKIEGLNGQLPNLDLVNLVSKMCSDVGIKQTFKTREKKNFKDPFKNWLYSFETLIRMVSSQATGIPDGNHGLFHRFGIQAVTLQGISKNSYRESKVFFLSMGRILEGIFRSLNNLLERFHQSYFFYLLPSTDRFISIGLYIPSVCMLAAILFIKACALWCQLQENPFTNETTKEDEKSKEDKGKDKSITVPKRSFVENETKLVQIGMILIVTHIMGIMLMYSPPYFAKIGAKYKNSDYSIYIGLIATSIVLLIFPLFITIRKCYKSSVVLQIIAYLELGTVLICLAMYNFSLALVCSVIYVPFVFAVSPSNSRSGWIIRKLLWLIAHPMVVLHILFIIYSWCTFTNESVKNRFIRGIGAGPPAFMFSIVDTYIFGNWLYNVITCIFLPNWLCLWCVLFSKPKPKDTTETIKKKTN